MTNSDKTPKHWFYRGFRGGPIQSGGGWYFVPQTVNVINLEVQRSDVGIRLVEEVTDE